MISDARVGRDHFLKYIGGCAIKIAGRADIPLGRGQAAVSKHHADVLDASATRQGETRRGVAEDVRMQVHSKSVAHPPESIARFSLIPRTTSSGSEVGASVLGPNRV